MCAIACSAVTASEWVVAVILVMFVAGIVSILLSVILIAVEVRVSQQAVRFEVRRVLQLARDPGCVTRTDLAETVRS